ncbi:MAG TPA: type II toxin-antitoxin system VapC family toxin [Longimicrobium sp.]|nr:type II toxin-antitoxin system VapC family toxin [Longimicrobium sp.]
MYFIDSSALVKAYVSEPGSPAVKTVLASLEGSIYISSVVAIETAAAMARLRRTQDIRHTVYARGREDLLNHCKTRFHVVHPPAAVVNRTLGMIDAYRMRSAGGSDLLHIATAEYIQTLLPRETLSLMCCDDGLRSVAEERGFDVFDPVRDPLPAGLLPAGGGEG